MILIFLLKSIMNVSLEPITALIEVVIMKLMCLKTIVII